MRKFLIGCIFAVSCVVVLAGCQTLNAMIAVGRILPVARTQQSLPDDKVVLVGRVLLVPEPEQIGELRVLTGSGPMDLRRMSNIVFTKDPNTVIEPAKMNFDAYAQVRWSTYFAVQAPRSTLYLKGLDFALTRQAGISTSRNLHFTLCLAPDPGERVVYIGDIEIHLDESNSMGGRMDYVKVVDSFESARESFDNAFLDNAGAALPLTRHLATGDPTVVVQDITVKTKMRY